MFTKDDVKNLEIIFALARKVAIDNEQDLINIITYKKDLFERLSPKEEKPTTLKDTKVVETVPQPSESKSKTKKEAVKA